MFSTHSVNNFSLFCRLQNLMLSIWNSIKFCKELILNALAMNIHVFFTGQDSSVRYVMYSTGFRNYFEDYETAQNEQFLLFPHSVFYRFE